MIIETLVTTLSPTGASNVAAMGVTPLEEGAFLLRPWRDTTTYRNLTAHPEAVIHLTDDAAAFLDAALGPADPGRFPTRPAKEVEGHLLLGAYSYFEVRVEEEEGERDRGRFRARVLARGQLHPYGGFNRARAALIEGVILATRFRFKEWPEVRTTFEQIQVVVARTGDQPERDVMDQLWQLAREFYRRDPH